jgi:hypothetical protein
VPEGIEVVVRIGVDELFGAAIEGVVLVPRDHGFPRIIVVPTNGEPPFSLDAYALTPCPSLSLLHILDLQV